MWSSYQPLKHDQQACLEVLAFWSIASCSLDACLDSKLAAKDIEVVTPSMPLSLPPTLTKTAKGRTLGHAALENGCRARKNNQHHGTGSFDGSQETPRWHAELDARRKALQLGLGGALEVSKMGGGSFFQICLSSFEFPFC